MGKDITEYFNKQAVENNDLEKIEIELLLEGIYRYYGYDFRNYAFPFLKRRIMYRIGAENLSSISALQEKVFQNSIMMKKLLSDFSISVTEMFRDPEFFLTLRKKIIPIIRNYPFIRIWHVGCASGEEVYSMAIMLSEEGILNKTRIYATDINNIALEKAKLGSFPLEKMQLYTKNYIKAGGTNEFSEYYAVKNNAAEFRPFLKENVLFTQHNLTTDQTFNDFHIIICRNVMIYFNKSLQNDVHQLLYNSLVLSGFLGLGKREEVRYTDYAGNYEEYDTSEKIYRKIN
ncbi:protein-glutamate O-methyltransferase CheR [Niallia sp. NCCP-28]|uniref:CheR family methyltransferase n=1 Tax=Niallia sp. NCCP-28 TaxID=2934712 RepID=UPI0020803B3C|nr:protein-glutamate O-methyltransferase CheR [Niallia sp. NCCP-28]GKU84597.1 chemotaxis protein R [Niallia sp. NCCP-28]